MKKELPVIERRDFEFFNKVLTEIKGIQKQVESLVPLHKKFEKIAQKYCNKCPHFTEEEGWDNECCAVIEACPISEYFIICPNLSEPLE
mgnify:CR=1 FL=1